MPPCQNVGRPRFLYRLTFMANLLHPSVCLCVCVSVCLSVPCLAQRRCILWLLSYLQNPNRKPSAGSPTSAAVWPPEVTENGNEAVAGSASEAYDTWLHHRYAPLNCHRRGIPFRRTILCLYIHYTETRTHTTQRTWAAPALWQGGEQLTPSQNVRFSKCPLCLIFFLQQRETDFLNPLMHKVAKTNARSP